MNTITIFKGDKEAKEYRGTYEVASEFVLSRDLMQLANSTVSVVDADREIQAQDIILFWFDELPRLGKVLEVDRSNDISTVQFAFGVDSHQTDIAFFDAVDLRSFSLSNRQALTVAIDTTGLSYAQHATAPDGVLTADVMFRQFMRRRPLTETYDIVNMTITATLIDSPTTIPLRLDHPEISQSYILKIGSDKITRLVLYNQDDTTLFREYQLLNDGSTVDDTGTISANSVLPQRLSIKTASADQYNSLAYAKDVFLQNEHDNEIEIEMPIDNSVFRLGIEGSGTTVDTLLGQMVQLYLPQSSLSISTSVSAYQIKGNIIKIVFGLSRSRLTDIINGYINKDF